MTTDLTRRDWLAAGAATLGLATVPAPARADERADDEPFGYCLNTSTISGQKVPLAVELEIAAKAGYGSVEPWIRELDQHVKDGGSLEDLGKKARDLGLTVESAIGFFLRVVFLATITRLVSAPIQGSSTARRHHAAAHQHVHG